MTLEQLEGFGVEEYPREFRIKPLFTSGFTDSLSQWPVRVVLGIKRGEDGKIVQSPDGKVEAYLPGNHMQLVTAQLKGPEEGLSGLQETVYPVNPADLHPIYSSKPITLNDIRSAA